MKPLFLALFALALGFALGLAYSWLIAPVKYVDANPALLRADFKDQYRIVIAASYASSHDLARARARLELLSATDPLGELNAQAQRMVGSSENAANVEMLVRLASDLQKGVASIPPAASAPVATAMRAPTMQTQIPATAGITQTPTATSAPTITPTFNSSTTFAAPELTVTPRPTQTAVPNAGTPFILVGQEPVCDPSIQPGLLQFKLIDARRKQIAGVEIIVTSTEGEDRLFTGFKPEVGDGYADFVMKENISYSIRVVAGGTFITNISAPICTDPNGITSLGGLALAFQQP